MAHLDRSEMIQRLADPKTRRAATIEAGNWAKDLCLTMGCELRTGFEVGWLMADGLEKVWTKEESNDNTIL